MEVPMIKRVSSGSVVLGSFLLLLSACDSQVLDPESIAPIPAPQFSIVSFSPYTPVDLGTLGGATSYGYDLNDQGQVAGSSRVPSGEEYAILWEVETEMTSLGLTGGRTLGLGINNHGQIGGTSYLNASWGRAFHWDAEGGIEELWSPSCPQSLGMDINLSGQVTGYCRPTSGYFWGFLWDPEEGLVDIGAFGISHTYVYAMNDAGQVAGFGSLGPGIGLRGFRWDPVDGMTTLETLGNSSRGLAFGINNTGQVVGQSSTVDGETHAVLWDEGQEPIDLQTLGGSFSRGWGINESGQVVGQSTNVDGDFRAFLWEPGKGMMDLGTLGGATARALEINNLGQIVGDSETSTGETHATLWVMLTPVDAISEVVDMVHQLLAEAVVNEGQAHSLTNKLNLATAMANDGKITPAINKIGAFINQVEAFMSGGNPVLTAEQGQALIDGAMYVISGLRG